jgi:hypothetical protein
MLSMIGQSWYEELQRKFLAEAKERNYMKYDSVAALRNDFESQLAAIQRNDELPERAKHRKIAQLKNRIWDELDPLLQEIERREDAKLREAWKDANPRSKVPDMTPAQALYRREILDEIEGLKDNPDGILDLYSRAWHQEDSIIMDAIADQGRKYLNAEQAKELQQMEDQRNPGLATLRQHYEQLKDKQGTDGQGRALQAGTLRSSLQLSAQEQDALAKAQAGQQSVESGSTQGGGS